MLIGGFGSRQLTPSMLLVPWILLEAEDHPWKWEMFRFPWGESLTLPCQAPHFSSGDKVKVPFSLWIEKCHRFHSVVIRSYPARGNLKISTTNPWKTWRGWFPVVEVQEPFRVLSPHVLAHTGPRQPAQCTCRIQSEFKLVEIPSYQDEASPQGPFPQCRNWRPQPSEPWHATEPE